ncbi:MAG: hypothetical protein S4CHLAM45_06620 [Chlamydiales bacterium]|nr:hypothetical protein [Chlamydiales bacterium]MCH9620316.1 hypothetical protein [Chlamydiales bacterium]MCH9622773.1 hypothetical protein [Chlamydiales bacterium]
MVNRKLQFDSWKIFRIISEFVDGFETMTEIGPSVTIFGSARISKEHPYYTLAQVVGQKISEKGLGIITGGGPGVMEGANLGAQKAKGRSCGICINLPFEDDSNPYIDRQYLLKLRYFFVRKVLFVRYAQACVFLPGGLGTLDELFETMTLIQTKKIKRFPIFLVGTTHWQGLLDWMKGCLLKDGLITQTDLDELIITDDPNEVADRIDEHHKKHGEEPTFDLYPPSFP